MTAPTNPSKIAGHKVAQLQQFTPEQLELFQNLFSYLGPDSYLAQLASGDEGLFAEMEAPALRQFAGTQGQIASRFSGMGMGGRSGSGFQNTMNQASSDFSQDLQSKRQGLQRQAIMDLMGLGNQLLGQRPYEQMLVEPNKKKSFWEQLIGGAAPFAGLAAGSYFGPGGAMAGYQAGQGFGQGFGG